MDAEHYRPVLKIDLCLLYIKIQIYRGVKFIMYEIFNKSIRIILYRILDLQCCKINFV